MKRWGFLIVLGTCNLYGQWEADKRLTDYPYPNYGSYNNAWTIVVQDTMVHIVWEHKEITNGPGELYYIRSSNSGSSFEQDKPLTTEDSHCPSVAVSGSIVHVVWVDKRDGNWEIYYKRSVNNGETWGIDKKLLNALNSWSPSIAVRDSIVHVVWQDYRDDSYPEIYYKRSVNNGETWEADERLTNDSASSYNPSVAVSDSIVHIVWQDWRDKNWKIYYKRSIDDGETWGIDERISSNDPAFSRYPSIAVCDSIVHVVWYDERDSNKEIYYKRSVNNGILWEDDERLTNDTDSSSYPSIAVCDSAVHVVWMDNRDGNEEIYYKRSVDNGILWETDERLTNAAYLADHVSVACWDCFYDYDVHIAWTDYRNGYPEIYYKHHKCEGTDVKERDSSPSPQNDKLEIYPNPSIGKIVIRYLLSENRNSYTINNLRLTIHDISGRLVKTLYSGTQEKGEHTININNVGTRHSMSLPKGIYFVKMETSNFKIKKKLTILR